MLPAPGVAGEARIARQLRDAGEVAETLELPAVQQGEKHPALLRRVETIGRAQPEEVCVGRGPAGLAFILDEVVGVGVGVGPEHVDRDLLADAGPALEGGGEPKTHRHALAGHSADAVPVPDCRLAIGRSQKASAFTVELTGHALDPTQVVMFLAPAPSTVPDSWVVTSIFSGGEARPATPGRGRHR
jgi:hypothetical protein